MNVQWIEEMVPAPGNCADGRAWYPAVDDLGNLRPVCPSEPGFAAVKRWHESGMVRHHGLPVYRGGAVSGVADSLEWVGQEQSFEMAHNGVRVVFPGPRVSSLGQPEDRPTSNWSTFWTLLGITGAALAAYHGFKRDNSVGWAAGWGVLGYLFPYITVPVALAQGYAKPAK